MVNFNYELIALDVSGENDFLDFKNALLIRDTIKLNEIYSEIKVDFDAKKVLKSKYLEYQKLSLPKDFFRDYYSNIERCLLALEPSVFDDSNFFTEVSMDVQINNLFHYFMNGIDSQLWYYSPNYYLTESLISSDKLDRLFNESKSIKLESRLFKGYDEWKQISYTDIEELLKVEGSNDLDRFLQELLWESMTKNLIVVINKVDS